MTHVSRTKIEALAALEDAYRKTLLAVQDYSDEDFESMRTRGGMSPKDVFAHLAWWNWEAPSGLERIKKDEMPYWAHIDLDELNAGTFEERRAWPLDRVMEDLRRSHDVLVAALESLTDQEFTRPTTHQYSDGTLDGGVWFSFVFTEHYEEHRLQLEAG